MCPDCGHPRGDCLCGGQKSDEPVPGRLVATVRIEKKGRRGKSVTVVTGLPRNEMFLNTLCVDLKRQCGTGGVVRDAGVELQGELRERVRQALVKRGVVVKG